MVLNFLPHFRQLCGAFLQGLRLCAARCHCERKHEPHCPHLLGLCAPCSAPWVSSADADVKLLPHRLHPWAPLPPAG